MGVLQEVSSQFASIARFTFAANLEKSERIQRSSGQAILQIAQGWMALTFIDSALKTLGKEPIPSPHRWTLLVFPFFTHVVSSNVQPIKNAPGILIRTATLISQVALVYFTGGTAPIVMLSYLVMDLLYRNYLLPELIAKAYSAVQTPLYCLAQAFSASPLVIPTLSFTIPSSAVAAFNVASTILFTEAQNNFSTWQKIKTRFLPGKVEVEKLKASLAQEGRLTGDVFKEIYFSEDRAQLLRATGSEREILPSLIKPTELDDLLSVWERPPIKPKLRTLIESWPLALRCKLWLVLYDLKGKSKRERIEFLQRLLSEKAAKKVVLDRFNKLAAPLEDGPGGLKRQIQRVLLTKEFQLRGPLHLLQILQKQISNFDERVEEWWKNFLKQKVEPLPRTSSIFALNESELQASEARRKESGESLLQALNQTGHLKEFDSQNFHANNLQLCITEALKLGMLVEMGILAPITQDSLDRDPLRYVSRLFTS